jgi:hypothetical protein
MKRFLLLLLSLLLLLLSSQAQEKGLVILVDSNISSGLNKELSTFISDLEKDNYSVTLKVSTFQTPEEVREYLISLYDTSNSTLKGAILMGNIPLAWQYHRFVYTNPDISPTNHHGVTTQFFSDLNGNFYKNNPDYPDSYSDHDGDIESEIWVSILPFYTDNENTLSEIKQYLNKNHEYRIGNYHTEEGFLNISEFYSADTEVEYDRGISFLTGSFSWAPFVEWGNLGLFIYNSIGKPDVNYAYENELQSHKYRFAVLDAHGTQYGNGELSIEDVRLMSIKPIFLWLTGCSSARLSSGVNIATETIYDSLSHVLVVRGLTTNGTGLGYNENGFYGKNIATEMLNGKSLGEAFLLHNNLPPLSPKSFEMYYAPNIFIGDLSLPLYLSPQ